MGPWKATDWEHFPKRLGLQTTKDFFPESRVWDCQLDKLENLFHHQSASCSLFRKFYYDFSYDFPPFVSDQSTRSHSSDRWKEWTSLGILNLKFRYRNWMQLRNCLFGGENRYVPWARMRVHGYIVAETDGSSRVPVYSSLIGSLNISWAPDYLV